MLVLFTVGAGPHSRRFAMRTTGARAGTYRTWPIPERIGAGACRCPEATGVRLLPPPTPLYSKDLGVGPEYAGFAVGQRDRLLARSVLVRSFLAGRAAIGPLAGADQFSRRWPVDAVLSTLFSYACRKPSCHVRRSTAETDESWDQGRRERDEQAGQVGQIGGDQPAVGPDCPLEPDRHRGPPRLDRVVASAGVRVGLRSPRCADCRRHRRQTRAGVRRCHPADWKNPCLAGGSPGRDPCG